MSYCDQCYPENRRKKEKLKGLYQRLQTKMLINPQNPKKLIGSLEDHLHHQLELVNKNWEIGLKQCCEAMITQLEDMKRTMHTVDHMLEGRQPQTALWKLQRTTEQAMDAISMFHVEVPLLLGFTTVMLMGIFVPLAWLSIGDYFPSKAYTLPLQVCCSVGLIFALDCLRYGADLLISVVCGSVDKYVLDNLIRKYEKQLANLQ